LQQEKEDLFAGLNHERRAMMRRKSRMAVHLIIGVALGAGAGYAYYRFIGCASGTCPLTSNPYISTLYGALIGAIASGAFSR
jgi:hypothetical protein